MGQHLTWANFEAGIIRSGEDRMHSVSSSPRAAVFADQGAKRIGMILEAPSVDIPAELKGLLRLEVDHVQFEGAPCLRAVCRERRLFREAYLLFTATIDRTVRGGESASSALREELSALQSLIDVKAVLSVEKQIGLFGELNVLSALVTHYGPEAVRTWVGPLKEPHDFRMGMMELEVKTTAGQRRNHRIHGLMQAVPSQGCSLSFVSITLGPAGAAGGQSLADLVGSIRGSLAASPAHLDTYERALGACGYREEDVLFYGRCWIPRQIPRIVPVNQEFPAITLDLLEELMGSRLARIEQVVYEVNLDGLGRDWSPDDPSMPAALWSE